MNTYHLNNNEKSGRKSQHRLERPSVLFATMMALCLFFSGYTAPAYSALYTITDLGSLGGTNFGSRGIAINNGGQVTGWTYTADRQVRAFVTVNGVMTALGTLGGNGGELPDYGSSDAGYGINVVGQVTGKSYTADGQYHAFITVNGLMTDLGTLGGINSYGSGINDSGQVAGTSKTAEGVEHAFVTVNGAITDLGTLGGSYSWAYDINASGQVTGRAETAKGESHAFMTVNGSMIDLGTLGGLSSTGTAINASGQVAGYAVLGDGWNHAFVTVNGVMTDLSTHIPGVRNSFSTDINASGQVVGNYLTASGYRSFVTQNGIMTDLNNLIINNPGWTSIAAYGINDKGLITGYGLNPAGQEHAFLLTPASGASLCPFLLEQIQELEDSLAEEGLSITERRGILKQLGILRAQAARLRCL
jgi:probable HAF family extracellular repeat protein